MDFDIFRDQLDARREADDRVLAKAIRDLASVLGECPEPSGPRDMQTATRSAIEEILGSMGITPPRVPDMVTDSHAQMEYMLRPSGTMWRRVGLVGDWWKDGVGPLLGSTVDGHVVAILPCRFGGYEYKEPSSGKQTRLKKAAAAMIQREAFQFYRPLPPKRLGLLDLGRFMLESISRGDIIFVLGATFLATLLGLFTPYMNRHIFDSLIPSGAKDGILPVTALLVGAMLGSTLFGLTRGIVLTRFRDKVNLAVESAAMMRVFALPTSFFRDFTAGELSMRVMSISSLTSILGDAVVTTGLTGLFSFLYVFQMGRYAPSLVVPGMLAILATLLFSTAMTFMQMGISRRRMLISAKLRGLVFALYGGVQKIKLAGAERRAFAKWAELYKEEGKLAYSPPLVVRLAPAISSAIAMGGTLTIYYFAGLTRVTPANYMAFNVAYGAVSGAVMALGGIATTVASIRPLLEMVRPILSAVPENSGSKKTVTTLSGHIEVNHLTFRYDKDGQAILDDISLKIRPGEYVAIVGKTGSGKSTLLRLLLGFETPETGAIYYDGHDLGSLDLRSVRQCIGVGLQNGQLFAGDIFSNIIITAPWKTLADAWEAARIAGIAEDIKAMPMGMHTVLGEGGSGVSGGQRQRLLIARAIVSSPSILYFDEATSALDNITQKRVSDSLGNLRCTRLVIAHRLSTVRHCDRILVLSGGRIVEEGTYQNLIAKEGLFHDLVKRQTI